MWLHAVALAPSPVFTSVILLHAPMSPGQIDAMPPPGDVFRKLKAVSSSLSLLSATSGQQSTLIFKVIGFRTVQVVSNSLPTPP